MRDKTMRIRFLIILFLTFCFVSASSSVLAKEEVQFGMELKNLQEPCHVVISDNGDIYVLDKKESKVYVFDATGQLRFAFGEKGSNPGQLYKPESLALSLEKEIIIADTGNSRVQVYNSSGEFEYLLGGYGAALGQFKKPTSVAVCPSGNIYVSDLDAKRITKYSPHGSFLKTFSLTDRPEDVSFDRQGAMYVLFPEAGSILKYSPDMAEKEDIALASAEENFIESSVRMAVDHRGDIFLVEKDGRIIKMDQAQNILLSFGSQGVGKGQFNKPLGISIDKNDKVYIADSMNGRVQVFQIEGADKESLPLVVYKPPVLDFEEALPGREKNVDLFFAPNDGLYALIDDTGIIIHTPVKSSYPLGQGLEVKEFYILGQGEEMSSLKDPQALTVLKDGRLLVADTQNHRVHFLNPDGTSNYYFGVKGVGPSQFNFPEGIAVDKAGYIYVADTGNNRIQIFNADGIYLKSFGQKSQFIRGQDSQHGTFLIPKDLAFNSKEQLFILDYRNKRIQVFDKNGEFIKQIGGLSGLFQFEDPVDIAIDENDFIYIADRGNYSVRILTPEGKFIMDFGSKGQGRSYFPRLSAIAASGGKIYVADYFVDEVKSFSFKPEVSQEEYLFLTRVSQILDMEKATDDIKKEMSRKLTLQEIKKEFVEKIGVVEDDIDNNVRVEKEEVLANGQLEITVKIPRRIIPVKELTTLGVIK